MPEEKQKKKIKHTSPQKQAKQDEKRRIRNKAVRTLVRTIAKRIRMTKEITNTQKLLRDAYSIIDRASKKGILHDRNASRLKSRLTLYVNRLK